MRHPSEEGNDRPRSGEKPIGNDDVIAPPLKPLLGAEEQFKREELPEAGVHQAVAEDSPNGEHRVEACDAPDRSTC